jgi:hypothetical protein
MGSTLLLTCLADTEIVTDRYCDTRVFRTGFSYRMSWSCNKRTFENLVSVKAGDVHSPSALNCYDLAWIITFNGFYSCATFSNFRLFALARSVSSRCFFK